MASTSSSSALPRKLKDPRLVRVFLSSPFGGIEKEREEFVARYVPQLTALCQAKGVQFVAVDLRWGITDEAAKRSQVLDICLREIERSDVFIGIYAQRYGFHGAKNEDIQRNIDFVLKRHPWLKTARDRSVTELEFMLGHLNKPGALPATFAFRSKDYDEQILQETKDEKLRQKYQAESPEAEKLLISLKDRVRKTKDKCLAIHDNYKNPEEAARLVFEDVRAYLQNVLLKDAHAQTARDLELASHDAYMAIRTALYVGGQAYIKQLDLTLQKGGCGHLLTGPDGSGKGALVSNWLNAVRKKKSHELVYHFVGCSKDSTSVPSILTRLTEELERLVGVVRPCTLTEREQAGSAHSVDLGHMFQRMNVALQKAAKKKKVLIVVDGVSRVEELSRTTKALFWLPKDLPPKTVTVVVTCRDDDADAIAELKSRGYEVTKMAPLTEKEQSDFIVGFLQKNSKELSTAQLKKIVSAKQAANPLYLRIVVSELSSFGNYRMLDSKIDSLISSKNVADLFKEFLTRLEEDFNTKEDKHLIPKVLCGLALAKKGLTETEIRDMLHAPSTSWSPLYFAIKDYLLDHSGLLRLGFQELREAVQSRYMPTAEAKQQHLVQMIDYFQKQRKSFPPTIELDNVAVGRVAQELPWLLRCLGDKEALLDVLLDLTVFSRLFLDAEYELCELWRSTGRSGDQIALLYLQAIEGRRKLFEQEVHKASLKQVIATILLSYLDALTYFLELNQYSEALEAVLKKRLAILESARGQMPETARLRMESTVKVKLSYIFSDTGRGPQAARLLQDVLVCRKRFVEEAKGADAGLAMKDLAACYHAIGMLHSKMGDLENALDHYMKSMEIHGRLDKPLEYAESLNNVGVMYMKKGNYSKAAELCAKALSIYEEEYFGHLPPVMGVLTSNIAVCYRNLNKLEESEAMYKKAVEIAERSLGRNHPNVALALTNLGTLEVNRNKYQLAEKYFKDALAIHKACVSLPTNVDLFKAREKYVYALIKLEKTKEAIEEFKTLYDQSRKGELLRTAWTVVWLEALTLLEANGQASQAGEAAAALLGAGVKSDVLLTLVDRADRACKRTEPRPREMTVEYGLEQNPASQTLLVYQAQEVLIPQGRKEELLALLDRSQGPLKVGEDLYHAARGWCQDRARPDMAHQVLVHAAAKFPDSLNLTSQVASQLRDEEKFEEALPYARRALQLKGDDPHLLLFAGEIVLRSGEAAEAKAAFEKVMALCKPASDLYKQAVSGLAILDMMLKKKASLSAVQPNAHRSS